MPNNRGSKFDEYEDLYVEERLPLRAIADEYGLNYQSLMRHSSRRGWAKKREKYYENVQIELSKLGEIRSFRAAKKLELKTIERSKNWEYLGKEVLKVFEKRKNTLTPREIEALIKTYKMCCVAQRLEDNQPTTVQIIKNEEIDHGRNPAFEIVLKSEDELVDREMEVERLKKELKKQSPIKKQEKSTK